jgi:hypothetical protein
VLPDRFFFITCRPLAPRRLLVDGEVECFVRLVSERRQEHGFLLTAWVFLPEYWHAIFFPRLPLTIARVMEPIKEDYKT